VFKPSLNLLFKDEQAFAGAQPFPILVKIRAVCWDWPVAAECQNFFFYIYGTFRSSKIYLLCNVYCL